MPTTPLPVSSGARRELAAIMRLLRLAERQLAAAGLRGPATELHELTDALAAPMRESATA